MKSRQGGFTLIEVIVVCAIIAIAASIAVPGIISFMGNYRLRGASSELLIAFKRVRAEAVKRGVPCFMTFGQPRGGQVFDYVIFVDSNSNQQLDAGEPVLEQMRFAERHTGVRISGNTFAANGAGLRAIGFDRRGMTISGGGGGFGAGTVDLQAVNSSGNVTRQRSIVMAATGSVRIEEL